MNKFLLVYIIFMGILFLDICYCLIKPFIKGLWVNFWLTRGKCPRCHKTLWNYNNYGIEYNYCRNHIVEAYYEDKTKVIFKEDIK